MPSTQKQDIGDCGTLLSRSVKRIYYNNRTLCYPGLIFFPLAPLSLLWLIEMVFDGGEFNSDMLMLGETVPKLFCLDHFSTYPSRFEMFIYRLRQRVLMFHRFSDISKELCLARSTVLIYSYEYDSQDARNSIISLNSDTQYGYKRRVDHSYLNQAMPPLEFNCPRPIIQQEVREVDSERLENLSIGLDGRRYQWVDL